jgi:hypothetical protein
VVMICSLRWTSLVSSAGSVVRLAVLRRRRNSAAVHRYSTSW